MRIVVTGGGTGGHIYPALSIADRLKEKFPNSQVLYIGGKDSLEERLVPDYGYKYETIAIKGFIRKINFENVRRIFLTLKAIERSKKILKEFKPDVVIGTGGYVCGPVVKAASKLGIFTVIHEQNAFPGLTNKLLARDADLILLGFAEAKARLKTKHEVIHVGNPVRDSALSKTKSEARVELELPEDKKIILIVGGSGGQRSLNNASVALYDHFIEKDYGFIHVTGKGHFLDVEFTVKDKDRKPYQIIKDYELQLPRAMMAADLIICSAGASIIAELNAMGKAAIIIPKAYTAENHQEYNGKLIADNGAAICILESELTPEVFKEAIDKILEDEELRFKMEEASKNLQKEDALGKIVNEISKRMK